MSRTIFAAIALVVSYSLGCAEISKSALVTTRPTLDAYRNCVVGRAKSFAGSPDSTESIIKSAMGACAAEKRALSEALGLAGVGSDELAAFMSTLDQQIFQAASLAVTEERAAH